MVSRRWITLGLAAFALVGCAAVTPAPATTAPVRWAYIAVATATPEPIATEAATTEATAGPTLVRAPDATFTPVPGPWEFAVLSIIDPAPTAPGYTLPPDTRLIAVEMVLANNHWPERITANPALLQVMDAKGYLGHCGEGRYEGEFAPVYLSPGDKVQGFVGCTISATAILYSAHYTIQETSGVMSVRVP